MRPIASNSRERAFGCWIGSPLTLIGLHAVLDRYRRLDGCRRHRPPAALTRSSAVATERAAGEAAVYRDQLAEIERDKASGLISAEDADYARAEVGRRLLAIGKEAEGAAAARKRHPLVEAFVVVLLPAVGIGLYLLTGSPGNTGCAAGGPAGKSGDNMDLLVAKAERHLAQNPGDGNGWDVLAPIYFKAMRLGDAEMAYRNALRILGPSAERLTGLAEVLVTNATAW